MIVSSSTLLKGGALAVALGVHGALILALADMDARLPGGASGGAELALGNSFADMASGHLSPMPVPEAERSAPAGAMHRAPQAMPAATGKPASAAPAPAKAALASGAAGAPVADAPALSAAPAVGTMAPRGATSVDSARQQAVPARVSPVSSSSPQQADPEPADRAVAEASVAGVEETAGGVTRSPRPEARPPHRTGAGPAAQASRGTAESDARAGRAEGRSERGAQSIGQARATPSDGTAAAANYPGEVMARLSRVRRPNVAARGSAVVAFSIAPGGGLADIALARSSGSERLDRAALLLVQRAAPFPPPPSGARRGFRIEIAGR